MQNGNGNDDRKPTMFETHAQTALAVIITTGVVGMVALMLTLRSDVEVMKTQLSYMGEQLRNAGDDRFRGADWRREERAINEHFDEHERRINRLEGLHDLNGNHKRVQ